MTLAASVGEDPRGDIRLDIYFLNSESLHFALLGFSDLF